MTQAVLLFGSKIGPGLLSFIVGSLASAPIIAYVATPVDKRSAQDMATVGILLVPVIAFVIWMYRTTDYRIDGNIMHVRSGPLTWTVDLTSVRRLRATRSFMSAPALSLDRIELEYGRFDTLVVSPADKAGFVQAVTARAPHAAVEGLDEYR